MSNLVEQFCEKHGIDPEALIEVYENNLKSLDNMIWDMSLPGISLIIKERKRQIEVEGWTSEHDAEHSNGELAMAAACYAAPERIYVKNEEYINQIQFLEPWPFHDKWDKRYDYGERKENPGNTLPDISTYTKEQQIDLLVKAGALIAAEIDRKLKIDESTPT